MNSSQLQQMFSYVDEHFDAMVQELKEVCRFPGTADHPEGLRQTREYILKKWKALGIEGHTLPPDGDPPILWGQTKGDSGRTLVFYNHYDVVPEGDPSGWTNGKPYEAEIRDSRIYARGVADNKGGHFCRLHAIEALRAVRGSLPVNVKFLVEGQEETTSAYMLKMSREQPEWFRELISGDAAIWEGGLVDDEGRPYIRFGVRGDCVLRFSVQTAQVDCHGRYGATIPGAAWRLIWALASLKGPDERVLVPGFYDRVLPTTAEDRKALHDFPFDEEGLKRSIGFSSYLTGAKGDALKERLYMEPTMSVCGLDAGNLHFKPRSIVPHEASALVTCYLVADQDPDEIYHSIRRYLDDQGFSDVKVEYTSGTRAIRTDVSTPFRKVMEKAAAFVYDKPVVTEITQMGAGPAFIWRSVCPDLPILGMGPSNPSSNTHGQDENLKLEDYKNAVKYIIALLCLYGESSIEIQ